MLVKKLQALIMQPIKTPILTQLLVRESQQLEVQLKNQKILQRKPRLNQYLLYPVLLYDQWYHI